MIFMIADPELENGTETSQGTRTATERDTQALSLVRKDEDKESETKLASVSSSR